jgi:hypothetical protein
MLPGIKGLVIYMRKALSLVMVCLIVLSVFCLASVISPVAADENYIDHSNEYSSGDGAPPEDGMAREEPRTRFKDA